MIDADGRALLCDFGLSRIRHEVARTYTCIRGGGRELFSPPEYSEEDEAPPNEAGDIYSFAMTILKLGTGADPFDGEYKNKRVAEAKAQRGARPRKPTTLVGLSIASFEALWSLLERMWAHNPAERPTASVVVNVTRQLSIWTSRQGI